MNRFIFVLLLSSLWACKSQSSETPIAETEGKYLYMSDIADMFTGLSPEDSINMLNDYALRWVKNQLVLKQAENNLSKEQKDVTEELENYRASLLTFKYEQAYIEQRMNKNVTSAEIEDFYKNNTDNFRLTGLLIKALFIKVPNNFKQIDKIRALYRSNKEKDFQDLEKLCVQGAEKFDAFSNDWVDFNVLSKELPLNADNYENKIIRYKYIDESDDNYTYFLHVKETTTKGSTAPLEHVEASIKTIILNRRQIELVKHLQNNIYNEALRKEQFKINIKGNE